MKAFIVVLAALGAVQARLLAQPTILVQPSSRVVWMGANVKFSAGTGSTGPTTFRWLFNSTNPPSGMIISTVAGNGTNGYSGDGGPATNACLNYPVGVAADAAGDLFIADSYNDRIRKVNANGIITTFAGNGTNGYAGDGGPATNACLSSPVGVAVDASGNLFIADSANYVIRKVDTNGIITTVAGNGTFGHTGDGGPATNASLYNPFGMAVDAGGNLIFSDTSAVYPDEQGIGFVRRVDTNGVITTVAGNGTNDYSGYGGVATNTGFEKLTGEAVDASGDVIIAEFSGSRISKVDTDGYITTVAGKGAPGFFGDGGAATNANLSHPTSVTMDSFGNFFFADTGNDRIRKVDTNGIITTVAGGGMGDPGDGVVATNTTLNHPFGLALDDAGNLFVADTDNQRIRRVNSPQWPNFQSSALSLNNVTTANAGNYQEVVSDPYGSVTSNIASLTVVTSPFIYQTALKANGSLALSFVCQPASTNVLLRATNLSPPVVWQPLSTNRAGADGDWGFTDVNAASCQILFYRSLTW